MSHYAFFEYQAKLTNTGHAENEGELVHCMIRMKNVDRGKRLHDIELHQQAEDDALFVINPRPLRATHSRNAITSQRPGRAANLALELRQKQPLDEPFPSPTLTV